VSGSYHETDLALRYSLVPLSSRHLDDVTAIERESYTNPWPRSAFEYEIDKNPVSFCLVALSTEASNELAGYCISWIVFEYLHIQNVTVHPAHRRRGLGRFLLARAFEEGISRGATVALLEVRRSNLAALDLYLELGFREAGTRKDYYSRPREDAVLFERELTAGTGGA
jgi:[ribosomal protein S18]-alanine N-acetyltransferase